MLNRLTIVEILWPYYYGLVIYKNDWLTKTFDIQLYICHPIRKPLASINQSSYLIYYVYKQGDYRRRYWFLVSQFYFQRKSRYSCRKRPFRKKCRERTRWYWYRWHWKLTRRSLEDLLRIVFIHEESGNLKVFVGGGEFIRNINEKKKSGFLQTYRCPLCDKCFMGEYFCSKHMEYCKSAK